MYFEQTALAAACVIIFVKGQGENNGSQENLENNESEEKSSNPNDNHTFVALIDIIFKDSTKRTCTGAIIHDNVVVTAADCFLGKDNFTRSKPELTASFVVIGTKKMFDTGYEQYLPIERIVVHPKYEGWTANLALVFTFAGMTSDKPGTVIPLAGEKMKTHLDSNVTLFSWGHARANAVTSTENQPDQKKYENYKNAEVASSESCSSDVENKKNKQPRNKRTTHRNTAAIVGKRFRNEQAAVSSSHPHRFKKKNNSRNHRRDKFKGRQERAQDGNFGEKNLNGDGKRTSVTSSYLSSLESAENVESSIHPYVFGVNEYIKVFKTRRVTIITRKELTTPAEKNNADTEEMFHEDDPKQTAVKARREAKKREQPRILYRLKSNKDWRRSMGSQQNRLVVENFGFVNLQTCRGLVDKALPAKYNISKFNDVICYSNADRCVDEKDSGAPAVRQGQLVAITVGGAECDGDQVAVGMRMACYCSWISDNLPPGSTSLSCCKNCCDVKHKDEKKKERRHRFRNRFI